MKIVPVVAALALALAGGGIAYADSGPDGGNAQTNGAAVIAARHFEQNVAPNAGSATGSKTGFAIQLPFRSNAPAAVVAQLQDGSTGLVNGNDSR